MSVRTTGRSVRKHFFTEKKRMAIRARTNASWGVTGNCMARRIENSSDFSESLMKRIHSAELLRTLVRFVTESDVLP
jgi:hypothetical protein